MFGREELIASRYSGFFGERVTIFVRYALGGVVQIRRCDVDCYVNCDLLRRPRTFPNAILEDTRDIYTRDSQLIERKGILNKTDLFERPGVSISHGFL